MKKSYFIIAVLVVCTSLPIALTSCSSKSDDEQEVINNSNSGLSRKKVGEIFLINIFFFPLYHGRKIFISVSRIRFTQ